MPTRRTAIATIATGGTVALSGCSGSSDGSILSDLPIIGAGREEKNIQLTIKSRDGDLINDAKITVEESIGSEILETTTTNEEGKVIITTYESVDISIKHDNYLDKSIDSAEKTEYNIELIEDTPTNRAEIEVEEILKSETEYENVQEIEITNTEERGLVVEAQTDWVSLSGQVSQYNRKAADIIERVYSSKTSIDYFTLELYGETEDLQGNIEYTRALTVEMSNDTANEINWDNFDADNLLLVADGYDVNEFVF